MTTPELVVHRSSAGIRTTVDLLDALMARYRIKTDYQLHKLLRVSKQSIYRYRANAGTMDDEVAIKAADLLNLDRGYVLARMAEERAGRTQAKAEWRRIAEKLAATATLVAVVFFGSSLLDADGAAGLAAAFNLSIHYTHLHISPLYQQSAPRQAPMP